MGQRGHFLKFGSLFFLEIAYNDSLQQCITSSIGKAHEKNLWEPNLGQNGPKPGPKLVFLPFSQVSFISFLLIAYDDSLEHCLTTSRDKTHQKNLGGPNLGQTGQNWI